MRRPVALPLGATLACCAVAFALLPSPSLAKIVFDNDNGYLLATADPPRFPVQFHANISTTAHLIDEDRAYPPRYRLMEVWYDGLKRRAKVHVHSGFEAGKTFLRRWDVADPTEMEEYCWRTDEFAECRRAYMTEPFPNQTMPAGASSWLRVRMGIYPIDLRDDGQPAKYSGLSSHAGEKSVKTMLWSGVVPPGRLERIKIYANRKTFDLVRLTTEYAYEGRWDPVMSWTVENLVTDDLEEKHFAVPEPWGSNPREHCKRIVGGWPQFHLFGHYLRV